MKTQKLLVIAATVCLLAVFVCGSAYALSPFTEIILSFCQEVTDDSAEAKNELQDAAADLADCPDEYDNCQGGIFEHDPATCKVVDAAMKKYGGYDSVFIRTAVHAPKGVCVNLVGTAKATDVQASGGKVVTSGGGKRMKLAISGQVNRAGDRQRGQQKIG